MNRRSDGRTARHKTGKLFPAPTDKTVGPEWNEADEEPPPVVLVGAVGAVFTSDSMDLSACENLNLFVA